MKLKDKVLGGIYEYYRIDNNEVVYRGSAKKTPSRSENNIFKNVDAFHREGEKFNFNGKYSFTVFRSNLRRSFGEKLMIRIVDEPKWMTYEELLSLERDRIQEKIKNGECYLNHDPDPLKTWKKRNT